LTAATSKLRFVQKKRSARLAQGKVQKFTRFPLALEHKTSTIVWQLVLCDADEQCRWKIELSRIVPVQLVSVE
jgi:hypothetical protein